MNTLVSSRIPRADAGDTERNDERGNIDDDARGEARTAGPVRMGHMRCHRGVATPICAELAPL
jgi:hypothetical protein